MKKFLLSAAVVALTAVSVQALDLPLDDLASGWLSTYDASTKTITYEADWGGRGWWLNDVDYSQYTDVEIEVAPLTIQAKIVCEYVDATSSETAMYNIGDTNLTCKLNDDGKAHTKQLYIQCGVMTSAPSITVVSAKLVDNSGKAPDLVIWSGEQQIDWWENAVVLVPAKFENLEVGDNLAIDYTINKENGSVKILEVMAGWSENKVLPAFAALPAYNAEYQAVNLGDQGTSGRLLLVMSAEDVDMVKNPANVQFMITGDGVIITKVEIVKADGIHDIVAPAAGNGVMYNLMGLPVGNDYKGIVIKDGKKYYNR